MSDPSDLSNLGDIVMPPEVSLWPPAPGWWILGTAAVACLVVLAALAIVRHRRNAYRRAALLELDTAGGDEISAILKRAALAAFPRAQVASLSGAAWLTFLDRSGGTRFADGALSALTYGGDGDREAVAAEARRWIERHRC